LIIVELCARSTAFGAHQITVKGGALEERRWGESSLICECRGGCLGVGVAARIGVGPVG